DIGTLEHVFDLKEMFFNVQRLLKVGGRIIHVNPTSQINHGFINVNATLYRDFYAVNGFELKKLQYIALPDKSETHYRGINPDELNEFIPGYTLITFGVFDKVREAPLTVPNQGLYNQLHNSQDALSRIKSAPEIKLEAARKSDTRTGLVKFARQMLQRLSQR